MWPRVLGAAVVLVLFLVLGMATAPRAQAVTDMHTVEYDMQQLADDLKVNETLSDFSTFSPEHQLSDDKAIALNEWLEEKFTGTEGMNGELYHGAGLPDYVQVEAFLNKFETESDVWASGGSVEEAVGGEALDLAKTSSIVDDAALGPFLGLVPLAATLIYEDITTGTNFLTTAIFSGTEDNAKVEKEGGVAAEELRWVEMPKMEDGDECTTGGGEPEAYYSLKRCLTDYYSALYGTGSYIGVKWSENPEWTALKMQLNTYGSEVGALWKA